MNKCFIILSRSIVFALTSFSVIAATPTPEQLKIFQQLSPEQQKAILNSASKNSGAHKQQPLTQPEVVKRKIPTDKKAPEADTDITQKLEIDLDEASLKTKKEKKTIDQKLRQFGYDLFAGTPTTFAPATDIPIPVNYIVGPGDTVEVQLFGKDNEQYSLVVTREGVLNFPGIGPIAIAGLTFAELKSNLQQRIKEQMIGVKASISMGALRSIRIFILGDAERPGSYTVSSLSTMTNALFVSGGIRPIGSLRNIQLKRNGKLIKNMDLYDLLLKGDTSNDARLLPGDVIFIPPIGKTVGIGGEVRRPAIYEIKNERKVDEVIKLAGGFLPTAYPQASQLERINSNKERTLVELDLGKLSGKNAPVQTGDVVRIYSVLEKMENIVLLSGHVERPGGQQWRKGMRITDLIPSTKGLLPKAYMNYILIRREDSNTGLISVLSTDFEKALNNPSSDRNLVLQPRDEVIVFGLGQEDRTEIIDAILDDLKLQASNKVPSQEVSIGGRVHAPGKYPLEKGMRVSDLLRASGRLQESAYVLRAELTRYKVVSGQYRQSDQIRVNLAKILSGSKEDDIELQTFDHLVIKDIPLWSERENIEIRGEVKFPGTYPIKRGETLSSVIRRAGGITDLAFVEGAIFMREDLRKREQKQMDMLAMRLESDIAASSLEATKGDDKTGSSQQALSIGKSLVNQLRETKAAGRLVIELEEIIASNEDVILSDIDNARADQSGVLLVKNKDVLIIPRKTQSVTVLGEVQHPTSHIYDSSLSRDEYINRSGGSTFKADDDRIYVVRANGKVIAGNDSFWSFDNTTIEIKPGDTVIVPLDAERIKPLTLWTNVTQILYQVGVAVAAFNSAGIF